MRTSFFALLVVCACTAILAFLSGVDGLAYLETGIWSNPCAATPAIIMNPLALDTCVGYTNTGGDGVSLYASVITNTTVNMSWYWGTTCDGHTTASGEFYVNQCWPGLQSLLMDPIGMWVSDGKFPVCSLQFFNNPACVAESQPVIIAPLASNSGCVQGANSSYALWLNPTNGRYNLALGCGSGQDIQGYQGQCQSLSGYQSAMLTCHQVAPPNTTSSHSSLAPFLDAIKSKSLSKHDAKKSKKHSSSKRLLKKRTAAIAGRF